MTDSQKDQRETLTTVMRRLDELFGYRRSTLMLTSPGGDELVVEAADTMSGATRDLRYRRGEGITGEVLESGEPAIVRNVNKDKRFTNRLHRRQKNEKSTTSFVCIPVTLQNEVIGTLASDIVSEERDDLEAAAGVLGIIAAMIANNVNARRLANIERECLTEENLRLRSSLGERFRPENIIGNTPPMRELCLRIGQVAPSDITVLLRGESGTGKELAASAVHYTSNRADKPFVRVNCAALNENLLESELFGHIKGAFTGATADRKGRLAEAEGGTLFLDEIGEFSHATQVKLLRVLQEKEFEPVGSNQPHKADVRIIAATNRNLEEAVADGSFRHDLYYRINVFPVNLPPLRDRKDDILLLANHFVRSYGPRVGKDIRRISTPAINALMAYHWPGNVRELENAVEYAVVLADGEAIQSHHLPPTLQVPGTTDISKPIGLTDRVQALERDLIMDALKRSDNNVPSAAKELGITPRMIRYKMKNLGFADS